jgi:hypothetical protein
MKNNNNIIKSPNKTSKMFIGPNRNMIRMRQITIKIRTRDSIISKINRSMQRETTRNKSTLQRIKAKPRESTKMTIDNSSNNSNRITIRRTS